MPNNSTLDFGDRQYSAWRIGQRSEFDCPAIFGRGYRLSSLDIKEKIGGDDVTDWVRIEIKAKALVNWITNGAIAELVNSKNQVVIGSDDGYESNLSATLNPGVYYLHFSSESSMEEIFTSKFAVKYV
jgi:hypothetical protein